MRIITSTLIFVIMVFIIPLYARMELYYHPFTIISAIVIVLLLTTQPQLKLAEVARDKRTDKGTTILILLCSIFGHVGALCEWAYFPQIKLDWLPFLGAVLLIAGIIFRIIAIKSLNRAFSTTLQIKDGQQIITKGLYSKFRHPSYTGAWILMLGDALLFQSFIGFLILGIGMFIVYMKRIEAEEAMLLNEFGNEYVQYTERTWKFLPGY